MGERKERKDAHAETWRKAKENGLSSPLSDGLENPSPVWSMHRIGELTIRSKQRDPRRQPNSEFTYVDVSAVSNTSFRITQPAMLMGAEAPSRARNEIRHNDVLFATVRPTLKRIALVPKDLNNQIASTGFIVLRPDPERLDPRYLYYRLLMDDFTKRMGELERGASYPAVRDCDVLNETIPVPPLATQREIASILGQVQKAIEEQALLLALTAELKRTLLHRLFTQGLCGEPQKQTEIGPVPESWDVVPLRECATVQTGVAKGRQLTEKDTIELPYLRVANVQAGYLDLSEIKTITLLAKERARFELQNGDIVLTEGGDFDKLGRGFIWQGEIEHCVHQNHIFAVRVDRKILLPEFFAYQSQSPYGKAYFLSVAHKTTNLACINTTKLKAFPVLIPPMEEQKSMVETLHAVDARLRQHQRKHAALSDLFRTLLHKLMIVRTYVHIH